MKEYCFGIYCPVDVAAGLRSYGDTVTISIESGDPGGDPGEFETYIKEILSDWFDGARVWVKESKNEKN